MLSCASLSQGPHVIRGQPLSWLSGLAKEEKSQAELIQKLWPGPEVPAQRGGLVRKQRQTFIPLGPLSPRRQVLASGRAEEGMWSPGQDRQAQSSTFQEDRDGGGESPGGRWGHTQGSEPEPQRPLCGGPGTGDRRAAFREAP